MYERILVPLDGGEAGKCGLREAITLAGGTEARLFALHVVDELPMVVESAATANSDELLQGLRRFGHDVIEEATRQGAAADVDVEGRLREAPRSQLAEVIAEEAARLACGLIVMGTHGRRGLGRLALGNQAQRVLHVSGIPVMLVRLEPPSE